MDESLFTRSNRLLTGAIYEKVESFPSFIHIKSFLNDAWYNFVVPSVGLKQFNWPEAEKLVLKQKKNGVSMSYYVPDKLLSDFKKKLKVYLGNDVYIYKLLGGKRNVKPELKFVEVSKTNIKDFISIAEECFPEWENNERYARHFFELPKDGGDKTYKNVLMKMGGEMVAIGCAVISRKHGLTYLHNMGTVKRHRRKGLFLEFSKYLCNQSLINGVDEVYALVEENGGSYNGFKKLGFEAREKYHLFEAKTNISN